MYRAPNLARSVKGPAKNSGEIPRSRYVYTYLDTRKKQDSWPAAEEETYGSILLASGVMP